jgi:S-adenosylmethionine:tRNA ribosyltransferase-isomerase
MTELNLNDYKYDLPAERIAQYPLERRDDSKLLLYSSGKIGQTAFRRIHEHIPAESLLVFNNTRVIRARLLCKKETGAEIEILLLEPAEPPDYESSLGSTFPVEWICLVGNLRKWKGGIIRNRFLKGDREYYLAAEITGGNAESRIVRFSWDCPGLTFGDIIESAGHVPLPPYITRSDEDDDSKRYQTIYSRIKGSVASPTAGLHFTREVFDNLVKRNIEKSEITLHVGAGTFQPVKSDRISEHRMHSEHIFVSREAIEKILVNPGKVIAVGTTSVRAMETLYWLGLKVRRNPLAEPGDLFLDQWEPYTIRDETGKNDALESLLLWMERKSLDMIHAPTRIIIIPGYRFRVAEAMITNFHLPGSTLILLVAAWTGNDWRRIYDYALSSGFRFLSYGDSSLLL